MQFRSCAPRVSYSSGMFASPPCSGSCSDVDICLSACLSTDTTKVSWTPPPNPPVGSRADAVHMHEGVMSGIITAPEFNREIPETKDNSTMQGFVTAIYEIGCLIGAVLVLCIGERLGRRRSIMVGAYIMIAGVLIQVTAYSGHQSLVWREAHPPNSGVG